MSDAAPPSMPPSTPRVGDPAAPLSRGEQALKVIGATDDLQALRKPTRLDGEVTQISHDGKTATIETPKGDVEVQLRPRTVLEVGQKVQVDVPAGQPPRQVIIRPAPENTQPQTPPPSTGPRPEPTSPTTPSAPVTATPAAPVQTKPTASVQDGQPVPVNDPDVPAPPRPDPIKILPPELREMLDKLAPLPPVKGSPVPAPLPLDAIVRLIPLPILPAEASLLPQPEPLPATLPEIVRQSANFQPADLEPLPQNPIQTTRPQAAMPLQPNMPLPVTATLQATLLDVGFTPSVTAPPDTVPPPLVTDPVFLTRMNDSAGRQSQSIRLPIQKQIFPFIVPVTDHAIEPPSAQFDMRVIDIQSGQQKTNMSNPLASPPMTLNDHASPLTLKADVIATTAQHFPVLSMLWPGNVEPDAFLLQFPATNMPVGTQIILQPQGSAAHAPPLSTAPGLATPVMDLLTGWGWPVLDEAIQILAPQMPVAQAMGNMLPNPSTPAQIPPAMLFFMAAIGANDLSGWLGDKAMNALRREGTKGADIMTRLNRDFAGLSRLADDPVSQDWKGVAIPMMWQNDISKIHVFYRHQDHEADGEAEDGGERSTRFLFDFHLTQIGDVQLDGYMKAKRLDLIVRTKTMFSHSMQTQMGRLYQDVMEKGGLSGGLVFQNRPDQWIQVDMRKKMVQTSI